MGSDGSRGPKPFTQRRCSTTFVRVPAREWPAVKRGVKREFRAAGQHAHLWHVPCPTPVVCYAVLRRGHDASLMILERAWREPLGAITPESLAAEGFRSLAEFRTHWMARERRRFTPTRHVWAHRVRPFEPSDLERFSARIFARLYGDFLDERLRALLDDDLEEAA